MLHKVTIIGVYYADLLRKKTRSQLKKTTDNVPAHRSHVDKLLYLNVDLHKCIIHHILMSRHQKVTICFQI